MTRPTSSDEEHGGALVTHADAERPPDVRAVMLRELTKALRGLGPRDAYRDQELKLVREYSLLATSLAGPVSPQRASAGRIVRLCPETTPAGGSLTIELENAEPDGNVGFVGPGGSGTVAAKPRETGRRGGRVTIAVTVPATATSGPVVVDTVDGAVTSDSALTVAAAAPPRCHDAELLVAIPRREA